VRAVNAATQAELAVGVLAQGRAEIVLGSDLADKHIDVQILVTGRDGVEQRFPLALNVDKDGVTPPQELPVAPLDTTAPVVADRELHVSGVTSTSATIKFKGATDDRPTALLRYLAYRSDRAELDSVDQIEANGVRFGNDLAGGQDLTIDAVALEPDHVYYVNVIAQDRTGNKTVYQKAQVQTFPTVLCAELQQAGSVQSWRDGLANALEQGSIEDDAAASQINRCFPRHVPQCVKRTLDYAQRDDVAVSGTDGDINAVAQKRPPDELKDPESPGKYWIPDNIEQIAAEKGWTVARYKSRHAGGFDSDTPNLMMVYVPGDKVDPPVKFDRWLNFPLPKDDDEPAIGQAQRPRPKFGPPKREEYADPSNGFPSTFTMVSQDRAESGKPGQVFFQMFFRGDGPAFEPGGPINLDGCVSCHPNGLRAISPLGYHVREGEEALPDEDWKAVELINRKMTEDAGFKASGWGVGTDLDGASKPLYRAERGPIMGPIKPLNGISRTREFIMGGTINGQQVEGCFNKRRQIRLRDIFGRAPGMVDAMSVFQLSETPQIDPDKVITAMACEGCHVNGQRWPLNSSTSFNQVQYKILVDQSMPLGWHQNPLDSGNETGRVVDKLTPDERFALANCLEAEFQLEQNNLAKWMTQDSCQQ
jgi:hypothetical protein